MQESFLRGRLLTVSVTVSFLYLPQLCTGVLHSEPVLPADSVSACFSACFHSIGKGFAGAPPELLLFLLVTPKLLWGFKEVYGIRQSLSVDCLQIRPVPGQALYEPLFSFSGRMIRSIFLKQH